MGFDTIIANGRVVTATDTYESDVAISQGKITAIGESLPRDNAGKIIDAAGKYVFPGGRVDAAEVRVHPAPERVPRVVRQTGEARELRDSVVART